MRTGDFDRLSGNDSPVHRLSPALKTVSSILFILAVTLIPGRPG
jgi:energy-coupling factor transporter transmembrane protein EcfT